MVISAETALVLFSGGQDSTVCLAWALDRFAAVETVGFDYGQRHAVELKMRERLRSLSQRSLSNRAQQLERALAEGRYRNRDAARYGLALASIQERQIDKGLEILEQLHNEHPGVLEYAVSSAQAAAQLGDYQRALTDVADTPALSGHHVTLLKVRSRLLLESARQKDALPLIEVPESRTLDGRVVHKHISP